MITIAQKLKIERIVNVFETGTPDGKYDSISIFADGKGGTRQITYGRSQTTEQGNLKILIEMYIQENGDFAADLQAFLPDIGKNPLVNNTVFKNLLKKAAQQDPTMRNVQDSFCDTVYFQPALHFFDGFGFTFPLSLLVIYDSYIHSGSVPTFLRQRFTELPPSKGGNEKTWVKEYVNVRHEWLKNNSKVVLHNTIYRTACFKEQFLSNNWDLAKPVSSNGVLIA
jgi:chitosanase